MITLWSFLVILVELNRPSVHHRLGWPSLGSCHCGCCPLPMKSSLHTRAVCLLACCGVRWWARFSRSAGSSERPTPTRALVPQGLSVARREVRQGAATDDPRVCACVPRWDDRVELQVARWGRQGLPHLQHKRDGTYHSTGSLSWRGWMLPVVI